MWGNAYKGEIKMNNRLRGGLRAVAARLMRRGLRHMSGMALFAATMLAAAPMPVWAQEQITVWWNKGYYQAEDDAIRATVEKFQKETGIKVNLSLYSQEDIITKSVAAVEANDPPDVGFGSQYDLYNFAQWASQGKLEPVTSIIAAIKDQLLPVVLEGIQVVNTANGKRDFYGVPISANMGHIFYWRDLLEQAGYKASDGSKLGRIFSPSLKSRSRHVALDRHCRSASCNIQPSMMAYAE